KRIDVGGGIGIPYRGETPPSLASYAALIEKWITPLNCQLLVEPGRYLVGNAGVLISRVLYVKKGKTRQFLIIDAAMNDLLRPSLYDAWHEFQLVQQPKENQPHQLYDIVGPVCETGDTFASQRPLPPVQPGDLVAILSAGAYGAAMASTYNSRLLAPEILVKGHQFKIVRPRLNYDTLLGYDQLPDWLR
nr:diaminopimelate decarboxylase [Alphaproteobacteria bacterium]